MFLCNGKVFIESIDLFSLRWHFSLTKLLASFLYWILFPKEIYLYVN